ILIHIYPDGWEDSLNYKGKQPKPVYRPTDILVLPQEAGKSYLEERRLFPVPYKSLEDEFELTATEHERKTCKQNLSVYSFFARQSLHLLPGYLAQHYIDKLRDAGHPTVPPDVQRPFLLTDFSPFLLDVAFRTSPFLPRRDCALYLVNVSAN
ncbi:hypothetical protein JCM8547_008969, partial [Rhodosporidiobolus lusitaniae]